MIARRRRATIDWMATIRVRKMTAADLPAVSAMAGKLVRLHHEFDRRRFMDPADCEPGYGTWLASQLDVDASILLVAEDDLGVVGYVYASLEPRSYDKLLDACANVHDIYVDERSRRGGVAEVLLREALREAASRGAPRAVLLAAVPNEKAQRLFARIGFRPTMFEMTCELEDGDGDGEHYVRLESEER
ncbi:GNAT family N-acetyltransferase [Vulgatibacter incomptus]|uniref:Histone acetyltransferase HPA2 n=1 Tax=Vulgatibacter incomptus TaxID=1391653 RepID=A0A0K1PI56_9BACT|nr:GNAT family N-acetyltransferase [Vulgatibacter incomptus]AKU93213.1 Histone acetyltransferase HPA2 [Vulgatibacter incomptus]